MIFRGFFSFFRPFLMSLFCQLFWTWFCMFNIFILGLSTLVGIIVLVFSTSKLFRLFFKMMFTIIFVGLVHWPRLFYWNCFFVYWLIFRVFFSFFRPFLMSLFCQLFWTWFCMFNIFILGLSTLVGIIVLVFSTSKLFRLFFKMMFTIIFVGLVHGLAILPVLLTGKLLLTCRTELSWSGFTVPWVF